MKTTVKIKIQKIEVINASVLFIFYRAINLTTNQKRDSKAVEYYGDDIFINSSLTESELNCVQRIHGKMYSKEKILSEEVREYTLDNYECDKEIANEGWDEAIENAISYVID
jgi:hypothetical protein